MSTRGMFCALCRSLLQLAACPSCTGGDWLFATQDAGRGFSSPASLLLPLRRVLYPHSVSVSLRRTLPSALRRGRTHLRARCSHPPVRTDNMRTCLNGRRTDTACACASVLRIGLTRGCPCGRLSSSLLHASRWARRPRCWRTATAAAAIDRFRHSPFAQRRPWIPTQRLAVGSGSRAHGCRPRPTTLRLQSSTHSIVVASPRLVARRQRSCVWSVRHQSS